MIKIATLLILVSALGAQSLYAQDSTLVWLDLKNQNVEVKVTPAGSVHLNVDGKMVGPWHFSHYSIPHTGRVGVTVAQILDRALTTHIAAGHQYITFDSAKMAALVVATRPENLRRFPDYGSVNQGVLYRTVDYNEGTIERVAKALMAVSPTGPPPSLRRTGLPPLTAGAGVPFQTQAD